MDDVELRRLLVGNHSAAVYGMSCNPAKSAHRVFAVLIRIGYDVTPVNPFVQDRRMAAEIPRMFLQGLGVETAV